MPQAIIKYNLNDGDECHAYKLAMGGAKLSGDIFRYDQEILRPITKHGAIPDKIMSDIIEEDAEAKKLGSTLIGDDRDRMIVEICADYFRSKLYDYVDMGD